MRLIAALLALALASPPVQAQETTPKTLYERVGRYDGISAIADEYLKGIRHDPQFARFSGRSADSLRRARQLLKDQLCALAGGPCVYIGRDMQTAHGGLGITSAEWATNMKYMAAALDAKGITGRDKSDFLALIEGLRPQIVRKDGGKP